MGERSTAADFRADSAVRPEGEGRYGATVSPAWSGPPGPNGGYIAALILRSIRAEVDDPGRRPRSITIHYLRPPQMGEVEIVVEIERSGRSATTALARLNQGGKTMCFAVCVLSAEFPALDSYQEPMPEVPPAAEVEPLPQRDEAPAVFNQHEFRMTFGDPPFSGAEHSVVGGWIRTRRPAPLEPELLALYADVWWPAPFPRLTEVPLAPTLDLTIHFRAEPPAGDREQVLGRFRSVAAIDGFFDEEGELWDSAGRLLAQSRQLAILRPIPGDFPLPRMPTDG